MRASTGFASWPRLKHFIEAVARPRATEPYVTDPAWYDARARGLVEMQRGGLSNALAQIRAWHPAFAAASDRDIAAAAFSLDDARLVYARQNGADGWADLEAGVARRSAASAFGRAFAAIEAGDRTALRTLLGRHPGLVMRRGTNGNTLLNLAVSIERDDGPLVRTLLDAGADPNVPNDRGWTALHQAACTGQPALVSRLVGAGAAVTVSAHGDGGTPLAMALFWGRTPVAQRLAETAIVPDNLRVNAGLDVGDRLDRFWRADGGLDPSAGAGRGFYRPHSGFPAWRPSAAPGEIVDEALGWAARNGALASMAALVGRGANPDVTPYRGTPLMFAVFARQPAAVRWLLDRGADVNRLAPFHGRERGRVTALHLAAQTDDEDLVRLLLDRGADVAIQDETYGRDAAGWADARRGGARAGPAAAATIPMSREPRGRRRGERAADPVCGIRSSCRPGQT